MARRRCKVKIEPHPPLISVKQESRLKCQGCVRSRNVRSKIQPLEVRIDKLEDKAKSLETTVAEVETVASRVDERSKATEGRVTEVSAAATKANDKAVEADNKAGVARSLAQSGFEKAQEVEKKVEALNQGDLRVSAKESVFFAVNSTVLSRAARDQLDVLGASIAKLKHYAIEVQGFADQSGRAARNLELSQRRAEAVGPVSVGPAQRSAAQDACARHGSGGRQVVRGPAHGAQG
ncbi:MAG: hypothetical protein FJW39_32000 [Acidobacteria bacterium]|nr:hypothetical protein [Acidobacteriota bacterium]